MKTYATTSGTSTDIFDIFKNQNSSFDREQCERDLAQRQKEHLDSLKEEQNRNWSPCMHDSCPECNGTGVKKYGGSCIHGISCPCPKCSPTCMSVSLV